MGVQVTAASYEDGKAGHTVADPILGSAPPAIAPGEAAIWIGNELNARGTEVFNRLQQCIDAAREFDFKKRAGVENVNTVVVSGHKGAVSALTGATIAALTEDDVAIMWSETFAGEGSTGLFVRAFEELRQTYLELHMKVS